MIEIKYDSGKLNSIIAGLSGAVRDFNQQIYEATFDSLLDVRTTVVKPGYVPKRTGTLARSITSAVSRSSNTVAGAVGTNVVYAAIHEFGGVTGRKKSVHIQPKRYLTRAVQDNESKIRDRFKRYLAIEKFIR